MPIDGRGSNPNAVRRPHLMGEGMCARLEHKHPERMRKMVREQIKSRASTRTNMISNIKARPLRVSPLKFAATQFKSPPPQNIIIITNLRLGHFGKLQIAIGGVGVHVFKLLWRQSHTHGRGRFMVAKMLGFLRRPSDDKQKENEVRWKEMNQRKFTRENCQCAPAFQGRFHSEPTPWTDR